MKIRNHTDYTLSALQLFEEWKGIKIGHDDIKILLGQSSADEDSTTLGSKFQRPFNWHFYNNGGLIKDNPLIPGHRTSEKRIGKLIEKIDEALGKFKKQPKRKYAKRLLNVSGRLAHHIQDMSTPSHVVPVYHGPGLKDEYENFGAEYAGKIETIFFADKSNSILDNRLAISVTVNDINGHNEAITGTSDHILHNLHISSAKQTLAYLRDNKFSLHVNGKKTILGWSGFWREKKSRFLKCKDKKNGGSEKHQGFGTFGPLCNNFGLPFFDIDGTFYEIDHREYFHLYKYLFKKAVLDTLVVIDYLHNNSTIFSVNIPLIRKNDFIGYWSE